jgi:hypothetical protein
MSSVETQERTHAPEPAGFWLKVRKTLDHHANRALRAARGFAWDIHPVLAERPVFVVGCSRAGTTLVYRTLSESRALGSLKRETHDYWNALHPIEDRGWRSHDLTPADAIDADRRVVSRYFYVNTGSRRFVDKNNQHGLAVPYLQALFPDAHFMYVKRSPGDNIHSLIEGWRRPGEFATWSDRLPKPVAIDGGTITRWCFFLPQGWEAYADAPLEEVCAFQYRAMNEAILDARERVPERQWTDIFYEDLLADPVGQFCKAFEAADIAFDPHLRRHCSTVLARPYNAFSEIRKDKWRDSSNASRIAAVLPDVVSVAGRMGY